MKTSDVVLIAGLMLCALFYEKDKILPFFVGSEATETDSTSSGETEDSQVFVPTDTVVYASKTITIHQELDSLPVDYSKRQAVVVTSQSVVPRGGRYKAEIVMLNPDSTATYQTFINGKPLESNLYEFVCGRVGKKTYTGYVLEKDSLGNKSKYLFSGEYMVSEPNAYAVPELSNVLYIGYTNPVKITAPNISSQDLTVTVTNAAVSKTTKGYIVVPQGVPACDMTIIGKVDGKVCMLAKQTFRTKQLPNPTAVIKVGGKSFFGGSMSKAEIRGVNEITAEIMESDFNKVRFIVLGFDLRIFKSGEMSLFAVQGGKLTDIMKNKLLQLQSGDVVYFTNIRVKGPDGRVRKLSPVECVINQK